MHVRDPLLADLGGEHRAKPVPPKPDRLMADGDRRRMCATRLLRTSAANVGPVPPEPDGLVTRASHLATKQAPPSLLSLAQRAEASALDKSTTRNR